MNPSFHTPEHPLPQEIQSMKTDDTVCKFCGISYLIHREVKRLQDELNLCKQKLGQLENAASREEQAKLETELWKQKFNDLSKSSTKIHDEYENLQQEKEMILLSMRNIDGDNRSLKHQLIEMKDLVNQLKRGTKERDISLRNCKVVLVDLKKSFGTVKLSSIELKENFESKITDLKFCVSEINEKRSTEKRKLIEQLENNKTKHIKIDELLDAKDQEILSLNSSNNELKSDIQDHMTAVKKLLKDNTLLKGKNGKLTDVVDKTNTELRNLQEEFSEQKSMLSTEVLSLKETLSQLNREMTSKSVTISEIKELNERLLKENYNLKELQAHTANDASAYSDDLKAANLTSKIASDELKRIKSQRQHDIEMHQEQLKEMRESYKAKLLDASNVLKEMTEKHGVELSSMENHFKNEIEEQKKSNNKEINDQRQVHEERLRLTANEAINNLNQVTSERDYVKKSLMKERQELQAVFESEQKKMKELCLQHQYEISDLKSKLIISEKVNTNDQDVKSNSFRRKFETSNRALELANDEISRLKNTKTSLENKMEQLQETVRNECEERLELTQSLCDARMEVLELQRKQQLPLHDNRTSYSGTSSHSSSLTKSPRKLSRPQKPKGLSYTEIKKRLSPP